LQNKQLSQKKKKGGDLRKGKYAVKTKYALVINGNNSSRLSSALNYCVFFFTLIVTLHLALHSSPRLGSLPLIFSPAQMIGYHIRTFDLRQIYVNVFLKGF
jgi:hypothetical protein